MEQSRRITRKSASNLALAFVLLPKRKRSGMSALYAFCREVDDIADDESRPVDERAALLEGWKKDIERTCAGGTPEFIVNQELQPIISEYRLALELFQELLRGVEMDLTIKRYSTLDDLQLYCYRVASVVGLLSIEIFGYRDPACKDYAIYLGKALQFTNILRDVGTDAARDRIYIPLAELSAFGVAEADILEGRHSPEFQKLGARMAEVARNFYRLARETLPIAERRSMVAAELMGAVYWRLLERIKKGGFHVLGHEPVRLSKAHKTLLIMRAWLRFAAGVTAPAYGF